jgi:hypothetical protein
MAGATANASPNYHGQLTAGQVDTITIAGNASLAMAPVSAIEVVNVDGASRIDYTLDGSTPVVGGSATGRVLPASISVDVISVEEATPVVVKLISAGTPHYSIIGNV